MKKLFILILVSLFCVGLFAAPKIPKNINAITTNDRNCILYCDNNLEYCYEFYIDLIRLSSYQENDFYFIKKSLNSNSEIQLIYCFTNEEDLDSFFESYFDDVFPSYQLSDTPELFLSLKNVLEYMDVKPLYMLDENGTPKTIIYKKYFSN